MTEDSFNQNPLMVSFDTGPADASFSGWKHFTPVLRNKYKNRGNSPDRAEPLQI